MNKTNEVPERKDIPEKYRWNLEAIYPNFDEWKKAYDETSAKVDELNGYSGKLGDGSATLLAFIKASEAVSLELERLYVYANMKSHEDLRESKPMELVGLAESLTTKYYSAA